MIERSGLDGKHCFRKTLPLPDPGAPPVVSKWNEPALRYEFVHLRLEILDLGPALSEFFIGRQKQADDDKQGRERKKDAKNAVETLPYGGFTSRAKIAVPRLFH